MLYGLQSRVISEICIPHTVQGKGAIFNSTIMSQIKISETSQEFKFTRS